MKMDLMAEIGLSSRSRLATIVWREVLDALKDRRTMITVVILPMLLVPVSINLPMFFMSPRRNPPNIGVLQLDAGAGGFTSLMKSVEELRVTILEEGQNLTGLVENNVYDVVVVIPSNFTTLIEAEEKATIQIIYDGSNPRSTSGVSLIEGLESIYAQQIVEERMKSRSIDLELLCPIEVSEFNVKSVSETQAIIGLIIPYFIGILSVVAGASFASDTTAGEKERRTLEAFLTMPVTRFQIIIGKYLGVSMLSLVGVVFQFVGMSVGMTVYSTLFSELIGTTVQPFSIDPLNVAVIALFSLILSMTGNAILMIVCTFAKSFKEAQQYTSALTTGLMIPMMVIMYLPPSLMSTMLFVPLIGPLIVIRNAVFNINVPAQTLLCLASSVVYLGVLIFVAFKTFSSDKILFKV